MTVLIGEHRKIFLSASRFQFVAIGPAKFFKMGQEMSLWQKNNLNRVFAVAREIIYGHIFSFYTIFLARLEHSNFNACKIFVKIMSILVIMIENHVHICLTISL